MPLNTSRSITSATRCVAKLGGGGGGGASSATSHTEQRAALLKPGLSQVATSWSSVCPHSTWRDCHLHAWASLPYQFHARTILHAAALAMRLPVYSEVLRTERASSLRQSGHHIKRFHAALADAALADAVRQLPVTPPAAPSTMQACGKCGRITLAAELTMGGYCYKCGYVRDLAPGIWEDSEGGMHIDVPAVLQLLDLPNTPENREIATRTLHELVRRQLPNSLIHLREAQSRQLM